jgi:hypothetical protein
MVHLADKSTQKVATDRKKRVIEHATVPHHFNRIYLGGVHVLSVLAIAYLIWWKCDWRTLVFAFVFYHAAAVGVTAGSHRLWVRRGEGKEDSALIVLVPCFPHSCDPGVWWRLRECVSESSARFFGDRNRTGTGGREKKASRCIPLLIPAREKVGGDAAVCVLAAQEGCSHMM